MTMTYMHFMFSIYVFQIVGMLITYFVIFIKCISDRAGDIIMTYLVIFKKLFQIVGMMMTYEGCYLSS